MIISCSSINIEENNYELAYNEITQSSKNSQPLLKEYGSDASGTKIIPNVYNYKGIYANFISIENISKGKNLKSLLKKYTKSNWRKDKDFKLLMEEEVKYFHGPLDYIYFSTIVNDTVKAQVLGNPNGKYKMTTCKNYLLVFKNGKVELVKKWNDHYE